MPDAPLPPPWLAAERSSYEAAITGLRERIMWLEKHNQHFRSPDTGQIECECCSGSAAEIKELKQQLRIAADDRNKWEKLCRVLQRESNVDRSIR
jgi:hypothetical protein